MDRKSPMQENSHASPSRHLVGPCADHSVGRRIHAGAHGAL